MSDLLTGPRLIIICGLPGSGKTSHAKRLQRNLGAVRFCADEWMEALGINLWEGEARDKIEKLQWKVAQEILGLGHCAVIEWETWARQERDALWTGARILGAAVELHFLDAPLEILFDRIRRRNAESPPITWEAMKTWSDTFTRPSPEEMALYDPPLEFPTSD